MISKSERNAGAFFSAATLFALLAMLTAACVPITDPRISAVSPLDPPATAVAEAAETDVEAAQDESPTEGTAVEEATPLVITHSVVKRPDCLDCHEAETGRVPAPANHRAMTEGVCLYCHLSEDGEVPPPPLPEVADVEFCLGCHGPFEELAARTEGAFVVKDVAANPHMVVPHDSTKVFNCTNCHEVHELPVSASLVIPQADIGYCYLSCHHEEDFTPCAACHSDDEE